MRLGRGLRCARCREKRGQREEIACAARPVGHEREDLGEQTLLDARFLGGVVSQVRYEHVGRKWAIRCSRLSWPTKPAI